MRLRAALAPLLAACVFGLAGCWDMRDVEKRTFPIVLAFDQQGSGVLCTVQLPAVAGGKGGGSSVGGGEGGGGLSPLLVQARGDTPPVALHAVQSLLSLGLDLSHVQAVVLGQTLAPRHLFPLLDYLLRDPRVDPNLYVYAAASAQRVCRVPIPYETPSGMWLRTVLYQPSGVRSAGTVLGMPLWETWVILHDPYRDLALPHLAVRRDSLFLDGMVPYRGARPLPALPPHLSRGVLWLQGRPDGTALDVPLPGGQSLSLSDVRTVAHLHVQGAPGHAVATWHIAVRASVAAAPRRQPMSPDILHAWSLATARTVLQEAAQAFATMRREGVDLLALGDRLRAQQPDLWTPAAWRRTLPHTAAHLTVQVHLDPLSYLEVRR